MMTDAELLTIYSSGLLSGAATIAHRLGVREDVARQLGQHLALGLREDPALRETVLAGARELLAGGHPEPTTLRGTPRVGGDR